MLTTYPQRIMRPDEQLRAASDEGLTRDRSLVRRMLAGDDQAFDEFADTYSRALYRFAMSRLQGDRELVCDVVQSSLCKALSKLESYRGEAALFTWLCSICRNEILMHFRSRKSDPAESLVDENVVPIDSWVRSPDQPDDILLSGESAEAVHLALDLLPPRYAEALEWKYLDRLPVSEIGERLSVGTKAAESMLTRAREAFRKCYAHVVGELRRPGRSNEGGDA